MLKNLLTKRAEILIYRQLWIYNHLRTCFEILTLRAALDNSCKDGFSLLQALSHSAIPSEERNLQAETIDLLVEVTTVFQTDRTPFINRWKWLEKPQLPKRNTEMSAINQARRVRKKQRYADFWTQRKQNAQINMLWQLRRKPTIHSLSTLPPCHEEILPLVASWRRRRWINICDCRLRIFVMREIWDRQNYCAHCQVRCS